MEYNLDRCKHYVVEQAGNAIAALIQLFGVEELENMIDQRQAKPNPKYEMMVKRELERRKIFKYEDLLEIIYRNPEIARIES